MKLTREQEKAITEWKRSCLSFICEEDLRAGNMTFNEAWNKSIRHEEDVLSELTNIKIPMEEE